MKEKIILKTLERGSKLNISSDDFSSIYQEHKNSEEIERVQRERLNAIGLNNDQISKYLPLLIAGVITLALIFERKESETL